MPSVKEQKLAASVIVRRVSAGKEMQWRYPSSFQAFPQQRASVCGGAAIHRHSSEISVRDRRVIEFGGAAGRCQASGCVVTLGGVCCSSFRHLGSLQAMALSNNALKRRRAKTHAP